MRLFRIALGTCLAMCALAGSTFAQNELDAFRTMTPTGVGTARALGMAGAFSAVGADFAATSLNPAGMALYRKSELMFTPTLRLVNNKSTYLDTTASTGYTRFGFSNVGYVYADRVAKWDRASQTRVEADHGLKSFAFSLGFNQLGALGRSTKVSAMNRENSITQYFAGLANGMSIAELEANTGYAGQAWWAYAIDSSGAPGNYIGAGNGGKVKQDIDLTEIGRLNEWTLSFAGNLDDRLYFGAAIGIQDLRYEQIMEFVETDVNDVHNTWANDSTPYASSEFTTAFVTRGTGLNLRAGVIAKPVDWMRVGLSVVTPTGIACTDRYSSTLLGYLDGVTAPESLDVPDGAFNYTLTTPFKVTAGAMVLFGKRGFVSADLDYLDYTTAKFKTTKDLLSSFYYSFNTENQAIRDLFAGAVNVRLGGELRFGPGRARLGYGHYGSILKREFLSYYVYPVNPVSPITQYLPAGKQLFSAGLGLKQKTYYIDLAFTHEVSGDRRLMYTLPNAADYSPELINRISQNNIYMTIGFTF